MKKALLVTTVSGFVPQFEMNNVKILQEMGYEVHYAANYDMPSYGTDNHRLDGTGIIRHQVDFIRSPYSVQNLHVYKQLKTLMRQVQFQLVHCHTPMGGVMARLAAHATKTRPVIYTAHGFHFFKGAPLINWLVYYPVERWLSRYTDQQICINQEDYEWAKTFHARQVDYIPGAGMNYRNIRFLSQKERDAKRTELGISEAKRILLSVGELIPRKNHESVIRAVAKLQDPSVVYVICGFGELDHELRKLTKELGVENQVLFAGYRSDVFEIYQIADLYVFPSYQEGLPMALLEAMSFGLPVVCSDIRGSRDLMDGQMGRKTEQEETASGAGLQKGKSGFGASWRQCGGGALISRANDVETYAEVIQDVLRNPERLKSCGKRNGKAAEEFSLERVDARMREIYKRIENL